MGLNEDEDVPRRVVVGRALKIGLIMSSGFVAIFGTTGLIIRFGGEAIQDSIANGLAWIAVVTGGGIVALGVWLLMGNSLNVSSLVVILSLAFWGSLWGIVGMILSVPITVMMVIVLSQFPSTRWVAVLLSDRGHVGTNSD